MRADRPGPRTSTVPRLCSALIAAASGVVLGVAALAPAWSQTPQANQTPAQAPADDGDLFRQPDAATVFAPLKADLHAPGRFRRVKPAPQGGGPAVFGEIQVYGNPPGFGAGATGFGCGLTAAA